jgi:hypothetical protein
MKYSLRTLLIVTILAPALLAWGYSGIEFLIGFSRLAPLEIPTLPPPILRLPKSYPRSPGPESTDAPESTWEARDELPLFAQCNQPLSLFNRVVRSQSVVPLAAREIRKMDRQLTASIPYKFV